MCGVNDVITHSGAKYYAHHVECLIRHSRARGIQPIVVEIPAFGARDTSPEGIFLRMRAFFIGFCLIMVTPIRSWPTAVPSRVCPKVRAQWW